MGKRHDVDLICQHSTDGTVTPLKSRFKDDDGQWQAYIIKEYKDISHQGTRTMPDGMFITDNTIAFECKITVFDQIKYIRLYYMAAANKWVMTG